MLWWPSFSVLPAVCTLRFSLLYYIASTLLYSTVLYYVPSLLCLPKWLTHNAVCVCGQLGRPLDGGRREGKRSGNGSWNHSFSLSNYSISNVMRMWYWVDLAQDTYKKRAFSCTNRVLMCKKGWISSRFICVNEIFSVPLHPKFWKRKQSNNILTRLSCQKLQHRLRTLS